VYITGSTDLWFKNITTLFLKVKIDQYDMRKIRNTLHTRRRWSRGKILDKCSEVLWFETNTIFMNTPRGEGREGDGREKQRSMMEG
jgi:hypothetical protein